MEQTAATENFQFASDYTVKECLTFIEHCNCKGTKFGASNVKQAKLDSVSIHDLFVVYASNNPNDKISSLNGTRMEHDRLLSSYRLKYGVRMISFCDKLTS